MVGATLSEGNLVLSIIQFISTFRTLAYYTRRCPWNYYLLHPRSLQQFESLEQKVLI